MKIAIISIVFPYPVDNGGSAGTFNLIEESRHQHDITFICPNVNEEKKQGLQKLWPNVNIITTPQHKTDSVFLKAYKFSLKAKQKLSGVKTDYFFPRSHLAINDLSKCYYPGFLEKIEEVFEQNQFDIIQVEFIEFAGLIHFLPVNTPKIFIHHEIRFKRLEMEYKTLPNVSLADKFHIEATKDLEIALLNHYDKVVTVSEQDHVYLAEAGVVKEKLFTSPLPIKLKNEVLNQPFVFKNKLVYLGPENHYPNLDAVHWFLENCWDKISIANPNLKFQIVSKWSKEFKKIHKNKKNIEFLGFVDDLSTVLDGAIMIVPLRIVSGMRMKILESISWNVPIISTSDGAEGLPMVDGENCMIANSSLEFIEKVSTLIKSNELANKFVTESQKLTMNDYKIENCSQIRNQVDNFIKNNK
jgi:glycosyltransferase involved in cell wall biosynthesis